MSDMSVESRLKSVTVDGHSFEIEVPEMIEGSRFVIVIDPGEFSGGTILYDKSVPTGKTLTGKVSFQGVFE